MRILKGSIGTGVLATAAISSRLDLALTAVVIAVVVLVVIIKVVCADDDRYAERLKGIIKTFRPGP